MTKTFYWADIDIEKQMLKGQMELNILIVLAINDEH